MEVASETLVSKHVMKGLEGFVSVGEVVSAGA